MPSVASTSAIAPMVPKLDFGCAGAGAGWREGCGATLGSEGRGAA